MNCSATTFVSRCASVFGAPVAVTLIVAISGCAGLAPIHGVPIDQLDPCLLEPERPRNDERTIDLSLLGQPRPRAHVVDTGDVLGIYIEGVLGDEANGPPVVSPSLGATPGALTTATVASASLGYPVTVRDDGTISLPYMPAVSVRGLTLTEVELKVRDVFSGPNGLLKPGKDRIFVTMHKPRTVRVMVVRKDRPLEPPYVQQPDYRRADAGRGTALLIELPAFENDVLHALVASGGLPGPDAENAVYVMRSGGACGIPAGGIGPGWSMTPPLSLNAGATPRAITAEQWMSDARPIQHPLPVSPMPDSMMASPIQLTSGRVIARLPLSAVPVTSPFHTDRQLGAGRSFGMSRQFGASERSVMEGRIGSGVDPMVGRASMPGPLPIGHSVNAGRTSIVSDSALSAPFGAHPFAGARADFRLPTGHALPQAPVVAATSSSLAGVSDAVQPAGFGGHHRGDPNFVGSPMSCDVACGAGCYQDASVGSATVRRIPLAVLPGEDVDFCRSDVLLGDGDVVFIESRSQEHFYTAGLLGGGKYPLPADEDTDLLDAIALADSQRRVLPTRNVGGVSSLNQDVTIGASKVIIFRRNGEDYLPIKVDLNKLKRNPGLSPVIMPGDRIVLQYTKLEAVAAAFERHFLEGTVLGIASGVTFGN